MPGVPTGRVLGYFKDQPTNILRITQAVDQLLSLANVSWLTIDTSRYFLVLVLIQPHTSERGHNYTDCVVRGTFEVKIHQMDSKRLAHSPSNSFNSVQFQVNICV